MNKLDSEKSRVALCQLKSGEVLYNGMKNRV